MLDIKKAVGEFAAQKEWHIKDERIEALMDSKGASELYFLATPRYFDSEANWRRTFVKWRWEKRWYLACAIDLGPILGDSDFKPVLYGLSREPVGLVLFARWTNGRQKARDRYADRIDVANGSCSQEYGAFLAACEAYVNDGIEPVYSSSYECRLISREAYEWLPENDCRLHRASWRPDYFTDKNVRLREGLEEQGCRPLGRMAKVWRGSEEEREDDSVRALSYVRLQSRDR